MTSAKAYILYENADWLPPLEAALQRAGVAWEPWFIGPGFVDLAGEPPPGVFVNRMSPSSHTRGNTASIALTRQILAWLESHGRRVINGSQAFTLETSKVAQYTALQRAGIRVPHTVAVVGGVVPLRSAVRNLEAPFITKHNCGGKGLGVQLFRSYEAFDEYVRGPHFIDSPDQVMLLQEYITPKEPCITRVEIVGGQFQYAVRVDTTQGFQLCPAETCTIDDQFCPTTAVTPAEVPSDRQALFQLRENFSDPIITAYEEFTRAHNIDVAGIECIENSRGDLMTYDINCTTNYAPSVEQQHGVSGMDAIATLIQQALAET